MESIAVFLLKHPMIARESYGVHANLVLLIHVCVQCMTIVAALTGSTRIEGQLLSSQTESIVSASLFPQQEEDAWIELRNYQLGNTTSYPSWIKLTSSMTKDQNLTLQNC